MITAELTLAEIGLIAATLVLLGGGIALLLAEKCRAAKGGWMDAGERR